MGNGKLCLSESTSSEITKRSASRAAREVRMFGQVVDHKKASRRPTKLPIDARPYLLAYLRHELATLVNAHFNRGVSRYASGWSLKQLSARGLAQCDQQRDVWMLRVSGLRAEQLSEPRGFTPGPSLNHRTDMRPRGYAPRGERAIEYRITPRGKKYSLLPALAVDGIFAAWAFEGPYPGPRSVLAAETRQLVEDYGCKLPFLPFDSLDYNPIELAFSSIKKHPKRYPAEHEWVLIVACYASIDADKAAAFFRCAGYENSAQLRPTKSTGRIAVASLLRAQCST
ncbi:hypothetical protein V8E36_008689 [Tilletia maclaganii]